MNHNIYCPWCGAVCHSENGHAISEGLIFFKYVCDRYSTHIFYAQNNKGNTDEYQGD